MLQPTNLLSESVQPELIRGNTTLYNWAVRTKSKKPSYQRHIRLLSMVSPQDKLYEALGGDVMKEWVKAYVKPAPIEKAGGYTFDVLGLPYYGPNDGKDNDKQFFDETTEFFDGVIPNPPLMYVHGASNDFPAVMVGETLDRWYDHRGGWFKAWLDPNSEFYDQLVEAHQLGTLYASSGVVPASYTADNSTGHIKSWLVGELSLVDTRKGYVPSNRYAVAKAMQDTDVLLHDYYGDPVLENKSMPKRILEILDNLKSAIVETFSGTPCYTDDKLNGDILMKADEIEKATEEITPVEKCTTCDEEAEREAQKANDELLAMQKAQEEKECIPCRAAVRWVPEMVKANKISIREGFELLDRFRKNADGFEEMKAAIEARDNTVITAMQKAQPGDINIAGGTAKDPEKDVDQAHMTRQRANASVVEVKHNHDLYRK